MNRICIKLLRLGYYSDLHATRAVLAISEFFWAITLFMPGDTFARPTYKVMAQFIHDEDIWACIWLFSACLQLYILITGRYHERFSVVFAGFNSMLWWSVVISMYMSVSPVPAAISGEAALALAASWIYVRSGWIPKGSRRSHADQY